jgi:hypothetical protein
MAFRSISARARRLAAATSLALTFVAGAPATADAAFKRCRPVLNVLDGTRYEGSDLYRVRAEGVSCRTARRVARRGTAKAVRATPDASGIVRVRYRRWRVVDDLRGPVDRFRARARGQKLIRWLFGEL